MDRENRRMSFPTTTKAPLLLRCRRNEENRDFSEQDIARNLALSFHVFLATDDVEDYRYFSHLLPHESPAF